jgi:hypothetical protein
VARVWYVNRDRQPIDWVSAVSGGRALTDILRVVDRSLDNDPTVSSSVWRSAGTTITNADLVQAKTESATGAPPSQIVAWTPPKSRFVTPFDLEYRLNNLTASDGSGTFYTRSQVDALLTDMALTIATLQQQVDGEAARTDSLSVDVSTVRTTAENVASEVLAARGGYATLAARLAAGIGTGTGTTPGTGTGTGTTPGTGTGTGTNPGTGTGTGTGTNPGTGTGTTDPTTGQVYTFAADTNGLVIADSSGVLGSNRIGIGSDGLPYFDPAGATDPADGITFVDGYPALDDATSPPTGEVRVPT